jgi:hypothetical protein
MPIMQVSFETTITARIRLDLYNNMTLSRNLQLNSPYSLIHLSAISLQPHPPLTLFSHRV